MYEIACKLKVCMYVDFRGMCTRNPTYDIPLTPNCVSCKGLELIPRRKDEKVVHS